MPELADPPLTDNESSASSWNEAMKASGEVAPDPVVETAKAAVTEQAKVESTNGKKTEAQQTDELLAELTKEDKPVVAAEDPDAILNEPPKGQVNHEHFKKAQQLAKERIAEARVEAETLKAEIAKLKATPAGELPAEHVSQMEALKAEKASLLERLGMADYAGTPEFESKFTAREGKMLASLNEISEAVGADKDIVASLVHMPVKRQIAVLDEMELSASARTRIDNVLANYGALQTDKQEELRNWKANATARQQAQQAQQQAHAQAEEKKMKQAYEKVSKEAFEWEPFRLIDGKEEHNARVETLRANVQEILGGGLSEEALNVAAFKAAASDGYKELLEKERSNTKLLVKRIRELQGNGPAITNGAHQGNGHKPPANDAESSRQSWEAAQRAHSPAY